MRQYRVYQAFAEYAAAQCGIVPATAQACAQNPEARQLRDELWAELESRLADEQTYNIEQLVAWVAELGVVVGRTSIFRARVHLREAERAIRRRAELAARTVEAMGPAGETDVLRASRGIAAQILFESLRGMSPDVLDGLEPHQVLKLVDTLSSLSKADVETRVKAQVLADLRAKTRAAVEASTARTGSTLSREDVYAIIDDVMAGK